MNVTLQNEHRWLDKLVGEWTFESECSMGPDQPPMKAKGAEVVRSFGGLWTIADTVGGMQDGSWKSIMTLGFDPKANCFLGTFIATMMTHMWVYRGSLDAANKVLTLDTEGPNFASGVTVRYQDIIEFHTDDHRTLSSQTLGDDGKWNPFMKAHYRRK